MDRTSIKYRESKSPQQIIQQQARDALLDKSYQAVDEWRPFSQNVDLERRNNQLESHFKKTMKSSTFRASPQPSDIQSKMTHTYIKVNFDKIPKATKPPIVYESAHVLPKIINLNNSFDTSFNESRYGVQQSLLHQNMQYPGNILAGTILTPPNKDTSFYKKQDLNKQLNRFIDEKLESQDFSFTKRDILINNNDNYHGLQYGRQKHIFPTQSDIASFNFNLNRINQKDILPIGGVEGQIGVDTNSLLNQSIKDEQSKKNQIQDIYPSLQNRFLQSKSQSEKSLLTLPNNTSGDKIYSYQSSQFIPQNPNYILYKEERSFTGLGSHLILQSMPIHSEKINYNSINNHFKMMSDGKKQNFSFSPLQTVSKKDSYRLLSQTIKADLLDPKVSLQRKFQTNAQMSQMEKEFPFFIESGLIDQKSLASIWSKIQTKKHEDTEMKTYAFREEQFENEIPLLQQIKRVEQLTQVRSLTQLQNHNNHIRNKIPFDQHSQAQKQFNLASITQNNLFFLQNQ